MGKGAHKAKKVPDETVLVGKAIKLADQVRALVAKSGLPGRTAAAALSCVASSLK